MSDLISVLPTREHVQQYIDRAWTAPDDTIFQAYADGTLKTEHEWQDSLNVPSDDPDERTFVGGMCDKVHDGHRCSHVEGHDGPHIAVWYWE